MRQKTIIALLALTFTAVSLSGCGAQQSNSGGASQNPTSTIIKFATNGPADPDYPQIIAANRFKQIVEEKTNGQLKVEIYPAGQLGDARTITEGVQMGTIEMGDVENGPMGRFVPMANLWDLPYLFKDLDHAHKVLDGPIGDMVRERFLNIGIRHLGFNDGGFRYFTNSKRPIRTPEDMKGLKIRVMESEVMIKSINAFGASAIPMAFGEVYSALDQGVVDGQENPLDLINSMKFFEVQKYLSLSEHFYYPRQYIISEAFYQKLSPEQQRIIEEAAKEACAVQRSELAKYTERMLDALKAEGMEIVEVDKEAFAALAKDVYPSFYQVIGEGNPEVGQALVEAVIAIGEGKDARAGELIAKIKK